MTLTALEPLRPSWADRWLWRISAAAVVLTLLLVFPMGNDMFRAPKDSLFRAAGVILAGLLVFALLTREPWRRPERRDPALILALAALGWTTLATLASVNVRTSLSTLLTVLCGAVFFLAVAATASRHRFEALLVIAAPALVNGALVVVQEFKIWNPFEFDLRMSPNPHLATTGLLGNPNDAGMLLAIASLTCLAAALSARPGEKMPWALASVMSILCLFASQTLTAILGFAVAVLALLFLLSRKKALLLMLAVVVTLAAITFAYSPLRNRLVSLAGNARAGSYDALLTRRLGAFLSATEMIKDDPLTGIGPGNFGARYFDYKLRVDAKHPGLIYRPTVLMDWTYNFAEVHNDHLEIAAEAGIPAYLLFLAGLGLLASGSFRKPSDPVQTLTGRRKMRRQFARLISLPLAVLVFFLALGQFPLQLAATTIALLYLAGIAYSWSRHELS